MPHESIPLLSPRPDDATVIAEPPGSEPGYWAGAPSAFYADGVYWLAYRMRLPVGIGRGVSTVVARSTDGEHFETVIEIDKHTFGAESFERPAIVRTPSGGWQLYVSCATPGSKHWWIDVLEADDPSGFDATRRRTVFPGDDRVAMKDPVVKWIGDRGYAWICCHPLDVVDAEDRMSTRLAVTDDGAEWTWIGEVLTPSAGTWDARGARLADVVVHDGDYVAAYYDGRASAEENCEERTGLAGGPLNGPYEKLDPAPIAEMPGAFRGLRYLSIVALPGGAHRLFYEASRADGSHDLRTEYVTAP